MSNHGWSPVRPLNTSGIFQFDEEVRIVPRNMTPIEQQRAQDGTPITRSGHSRLRPQGPALKLPEFEAVNKSVEAARKDAAAEKEKNKVDPAEVVKSYLAL